MARREQRGLKSASGWRRAPISNLSALRRFFRLLGANPRQARDGHRRLHGVRFYIAKRFRTVGLVDLLANQINGCSVCVDMHPRMMRKAGETDERLCAVAAWRDAPYFNDAERAALALTEGFRSTRTRACGTAEGQCKIPPRLQPLRINRI
jgi:AhpD family alkylhydroperoxidase